MTEQNSNYRFEAIIGLSNMIGFYICIGMPIVASLRLISADDRIICGNYLFWFSLSGILIFFSTLLILLIFKRYFHKYRWIANFFLFFAGVWSWLHNFDPYPNIWIIEVPFAFAPITSAAVFLHDYNIENRFKFINSESISENVKLARINMECGTWSGLLISLLSGYTILAITYASLYPEITTLMAKNPHDSKLFFDLMWTTLIGSALIFLLTLCREIVSKILYTQDQIIKIPKDKHK